MIRTDELRAVPLLSALAETELEYLADQAADVHVLPGEYVVHEGAPRALIITLEGRLEVTKVIEGIERVVGIRTQGDLFGEVPTVLNTPFVASLRAVEPSRVIQIEPKTYHVLAAAAPSISAALGAAALDRIEGLQDIAAKPPPPELHVIGPQRDSACQTLRDFLRRNQVPFEWLAPDDPAARVLGIESDGKKDRYPIVRTQKGEVLVDPVLRDVAKVAGLSVAPSREHYDVIIVGGGPAGLAAAVYSSSEGLHTILIEREAPGGQAGTSSRIENYLGFPFGVSGDELANRALQQARRLGAEIVVTRSVEGMNVAPLSVSLDGGDVLHARSIILALGVTYRRLSIEGFDRLTGKGIYYGAARSEASWVQRQDVYLIGAGNSAGQAALLFANHARSVTLLVRGDSIAKSMSYYLIEQLKTKSNISIELRSEVTAIHGDEHLEAIEVRNHATGASERRPTTGLFVFIGANADTGWLPTEIARDPRGYVITGNDLVKAARWSNDRDPYLIETSVPGVFAVGDIRAGSIKRVASGVGEGSMAIAFVHHHLRHLEETAARPGMPTASR